MLALGDSQRLIVGDAVPDLICGCFSDCLGWWEFASALYFSAHRAGTEAA